MTEFCAQTGEEDLEEAFVKMVCEDTEMSVWDLIRVVAHKDCWMDLEIEGR